MHIHIVYVCLYACRYEPICIDCGHRHTVYVNNVNNEIIHTPISFEYFLSISQNIMAIWCFGFSYGDKHKKKEYKTQFLQQIG